MNYSKNQVLLVVGPVPWYTNLSNAFLQYGKTWLQQKMKLNPDLVKIFNRLISAEGYFYIYGYSTDICKIKHRFKITEIIQDTTRRIPPPDNTAPIFSQYDVDKGGCENNTLEYHLYFKVVNIEYLNAGDLQPKDFTFIKTGNPVDRKRMNPGRFYVSVNKEHVNNTQQSDDLYVDLKKINNDDTLSDTEKETLVNARIGQGRFRENVVATWGIGGRCPVTKIDISELLIASHIRPWANCTSKEERLDGANGILLCSHLDKLFDNHLISFEKKSNKYIGVINKKIDQEQLSKIGLEKEFTIDTRCLSSKNKERVDGYLKEHHSLFKKRNEV